MLRDTTTKTGQLLPGSGRRDSKPEQARQVLEQILVSSPTRGALVRDKLLKKIEAKQKEIEDQKQQEVITEAVLPPAQEEVEVESAAQPEPDPESSDMAVLETPASPGFKEPGTTTDSWNVKNMSNFWEYHMLKKK